MTHDEWEHEYHLTPLGWVEGSFYFRGTLTRKIPTPRDRVITMVQENTSESSYADLKTSWRHGWKSSEHTHEQIGGLLAAFGHRPPALFAH
jgi:hypothetical protein